MRNAHSLTWNISKKTKYKTQKISMQFLYARQNLRHPTIDLELSAAQRM